MPYILIGLCLNEVVGQVVCCSKVWKTKLSHIKDLFLFNFYLCNLLFGAYDATGCDKRMGHLDRQLRF